MPWSEQEKYQPKPFQSTRRFPTWESRIASFANIAAWCVTVTTQLAQFPMLCSFLRAVRSLEEKGKKFSRFRSPLETDASLDSFVNLPLEHLPSSSPLLPFSIVRAENCTPGEPPILLVVPGFVIDQAGSNGVVKVGFPVIFNAQTNQYNIAVNAPMAVKVIYKFSAFEDPKNPTATIWPALYPKQVYMMQRSEEERVSDMQGRGSRHHAKCYLVLPLIEGCALHSVIDSLSQELNFLEKIQLSMALIDAVKKLHDIGWLHLDIKPENFIIKRLPDGSFAVELIDFDQVRKSGTLIPRFGTLEYLAPEMLPPGVQWIATYALDIFALGIVLAELWIGSELILEKRFAMVEQYRPLKEIPEDKRTEFLPNRENLYLVDSGQEDSISNDIVTLTWAQRYFSEMQDDAQLLYQPLQKILFRMMNPNAQGSAIAAAEEDRLPRPSLDEIKEVFIKTKKEFPGYISKVPLRFFSPSCCSKDSLMQQLLTGRFAPIPVPAQ